MSPPQNPSSEPPSWHSGRSKKTSARRVQATPRWVRGEANASAGLPAPSPRWSRPARLAFAAMAGVVAAGLLIWLVLWIRPVPRGQLLVFGAGYQDALDLPHNAYGLNGLIALRRDPAVLRATQPDVVTLTSDAPLYDALTRSSARLTVLVLAFHGAADARGPFLYLDRERLDRPPPRLYLADLVARLGQLAPRRFVLVVDATQSPAFPRLGVLENDFAARLDDLRPRVEAASNLVVMAANARGQRSWVSERWRSTIFTHFLAEGLAGDRGGPAGSPIDAESLFRSVHTKVSRWALANRRAEQTPVLWPGDGRRARNFLLGLVTRSAPGSDARPVVAATPAAIPDAERDAWDAAWNDYRESAARPGPAIDTPRLWREYRDRLIRFDQLVRADDPAATTFKATLDTLRDRLRRGAVVALGSARNSLAMPAVEGRAAADPARVQAEFNVLWADPDAVRDDGKSAVDPARRWAFTELLYRRAAAEPSPETLATASRLVPELTAAGRPRPAEVHFLAMLAANAPASPVDPPAYQALLSRALKVRARAERAAVAVRPGGPSFSERVAPWVASLVAEADTLRRRGEDLVFANDRHAWEQAAASLDAADQRYDQADAIANRAREAVLTCDRAQADLPCYAEWAAALPPPTGSAPDPADQVAVLLARAQALAPRLLPDGPAPSDAIDPIAAEANGLAEALAALDRTYQASVDPADYETSAAALLTPFVADRESLARRLVELSPEAAVRDGSTPIRDPDPLAAKRRERLNLALLGDDWTEAEIQAEPEAALPRDSTRIDRAGAVIASRWQALPKLVGRLTEPPAGAIPGASSADLARADRLARRIPGGDLGPTEPAEAARARLLQNLLIAQARRTLADHWFGPDDAPDSEPYYRAAGLAYLKDARDLDPLRGRRDRSAVEAEALRAALQRVDRLEVTGPPPLVVTSEDRAEVEYRLRVAAGSAVPDGLPVVWLRSDPPNWLAVDASGEGRTSRELKGGAAGYRAGLDLALTRQAEARPAEFRRPEPRKATVTLHGFYRGQTLRVETPVAFHPVPEITVVKHPLPTRAKVALSTDPPLLKRYGESGGALAIVLDCSGSMAGTRYQQVTAALRQLLGTIARGTRVSLWVFGEAMPGANDVDAAEQTILRVLAPTPWEPGNPAQLDAVMALVDPSRLQPNNESPIVRTMIRARDDLADVEGFKTLLVLTDGKDNRFEKDAEFNRAKKSIPDAIRDAFGRSDIEINVVGFKLLDAEQVEARAQFKVIEELPRPGRFFAVNDARQLAATLGLAFRPNLRVAVETLGNEPRATLTVGRAGQAERWSEPGLTPGGYKVVARDGGRQERDVVLERGDLLLLRLGERQGNLTIDRELFRGDPRPKSAEERAQGWRLALVRNGLAGPAHDRLALWATLEKLPLESESALQVVKPREVWMEVGQAGGASGKGETIAQRWSNVVGLPAPCWGVSVPAWPRTGDASAPARPVVRVWYDPDQEASTTSEVARLADFGSTDELSARAVRVGNRSVQVESVTIETRRVEVSEGQFRPLSCLVVRLRHEEGDPFRVGPLGLRPEGVEHRFYTKANRYTGIFWPVTRDQADVALRGLGLVSVADFKARAERRGYLIERQAPGAPDTRDAGPGLVPFEEPGPAAIDDEPR